MNESRKAIIKYVVIFFWNSFHCIEVMQQRYFAADLERDDRTEERIKRILNHDILKDFPVIDKTYSSAFKFLHWINEKRQEISQKKIL